MCAPIGILSPDVSMCTVHAAPSHSSPRLHWSWSTLFRFVVKYLLYYQAGEEWEGEAEDEHLGRHEKEVVERTSAEVDRDYPK